MESDLISMHFDNTHTLLLAGRWSRQAFDRVFWKNDDSWDIYGGPDVRYCIQCGVENTCHAVQYHIVHLVLYREIRWPVNTVYLNHCEAILLLCIIWGTYTCVTGRVHVNVYNNNSIIYLFTCLFDSPNAN
jgi:hypothetical protein